MFANQSTKYRSYSIKEIKKEELDKYVSQHLTSNDIKVITAQKTDNEFVLDVNARKHNNANVLTFKHPRGAFVFVYLYTNN